ncbi:hypothetical protein PT276_06840 [Orbaceae bacterium ESL0721]|nr:hypothetical protein [Orbaceae bacterium ESL0721]
MVLSTESIKQSANQLNLPFATLPEMAIQIQQRDPYQRFQQFIDQFFGSIC